MNNRSMFGDIKLGFLIELSKCEVIDTMPTENGRDLMEKCVSD